MEVSEAALEQLIQKQRNIIETQISALNPTEISIASSKITDNPTTLEYRDVREAFLQSYDNPLPIPTVTTYSDYLLSNPKNTMKFPKDHRQFLLKFFKNEINRVKLMGKIVCSRIYNPEIAFQNQNQYSLYTEATSKHFAICEEGLQRLTAQTLMTFNANDLFLELSHYFFEKRRTGMYKAYLDAISLFSMTNRRSIFQNLYVDITKMFEKDASQNPLPIQIINEAPLDMELKRLAQRFDLNPDLNLHDGQMFVYQANKTFESMWPILNTFQFPKKNVVIQGKKIQRTTIELTQKALFKQIPREYKFQAIMEHIIKWRDDEVTMAIREQSQYYNTSIASLRKDKKDRTRIVIPLHKISAWLELRFIHMKYLACSIMSLLNYFENIKLRLSTSHKFVSSSLHVNKVHLGSSPYLKSLIEISDENGPFLFQSAVDKFDEFRDLVSAIGSYHTKKEIEGSQNLDRDAIVEKILQHHFHFLNAKRKLVQALIETLNHGWNANVVMKIYETIEESPILNLPTFKSIDVPYEAAIDLMERKANLIRGLVNMQIQHERQISTQFFDNIPLFDKTLMLNTEKYRMFDESMPISPFEVYSSLTNIYKFLELIPRLVNELGESSDIKIIKFGYYIETAVLKEIEKLLSKSIQCGLFPFDRASTDFHFLLSDSVNSLFTSPYINSLNSIKSLMETMNEGRKLRFLMSARKFAKFTWILQKEVIKTNLLQTTYFTQCDQLGIGERTVLLSSFKDNVMKEIIDMTSTTSNDKIIDFALSEFEAISINFSAKSTIKDIIIVGNYDKLNDLLRFQRLQNVILEIAVRFNSLILDSDFHIEFFELDDKKEKIEENQSNFFLTATEEVEPLENETKPDKDPNQSYFKQFVAAQLFMNSTTIVRDNKLAFEDKTLFLVSIKSLKSQARTFLQGQYKLRDTIPHQELFDMYMNEMISTFSSYMYRCEMAHITHLERQILLSNSFIEVFIIGPDPQLTFVNEAGRFESFFYIPTWVECCKMLHTAGQQVQTVVLKPTLDFVILRYQLLSLARYESSLSLNSDQALVSLYDGQFPYESPIFQKISNEFSRLPNSREIDVASNYMKDRYIYYFYRLEHTLLISFESSFTTIHQIGSTDAKYDEIITDIWSQLHDPLTNHLITARRYVPLYQDQLFYNANEMERNDIMNKFASTDSMIDEAASSLRRNAFMDFFQLLPSLLDFIQESVSLIQLKFAFFLLLHHTPETEINPTSCIMNMTQQIYYEETKIWTDLIVDQAMAALVSRDEPHHLQEKPPITKVHRACIEQIHNQVDRILLSNQIKNLKSSIHKFSADFAAKHPKSTYAFKPDFLINNNILTAPPKDQIFVISPNEADDQFKQENLYCHVMFVNFVANALDSCTLERRDHDGTYTTIFDSDGFEENCYKLTTALEIFSKGSLSDQNLTWRQYIATLASQLKKNMEAKNIVNRIIDFTRKRFERLKESEIGFKLSDQILELNTLNDQINTLKQNRASTDLEIAKVVNKDFERLVNDITVEINKKKMQFTGIKKNVLKGVMNRISIANEVKFEIDHNILRNEEHERENDPQDKEENEKQLQLLREENEAARKRVLKLRIIRCLNDIFIQRYFRKRLSAVENDRKQANATFWSNKLQYETQEMSMLKQLDETRIRLADTEIEVEKLKKQLENEKVNNIQLVHWKAKNFKAVDELKQKISEIKNVSDVNIDQLLAKMQERQEKLDALIAETNVIEKDFNEQVREPMKEIDRLRSEVQKTKMARLDLIAAMPNDDEIDEMIAQNNSYQAILDENAQLRHNNLLLKSQVEELEAKKEKKPKDAKNFMERTTQPAPPTLRSQKMPGIIIKPTVTNRSFSRI